MGNLPPDGGVLTQDIVSFGFSFLILIGVWNRYTATTSVMPVETPGMIRLNMALLFLVAIEPFLFDVLSKGLSTDAGATASVYYGFDIGLMNVILAYFTHLLASEEKGLIPKELMHHYKLIRNFLLVASGLFLVSTLPVFEALSLAGEPIRVYLWFLSLPILWAPRVFSYAT